MEENASAIREFLEQQGYTNIDILGQKSDRWLVVDVTDSNGIRKTVYVDTVANRVDERAWGTAAC